MTRIRSLGENAAEIERVVRAEEERFGETLERGMRLFDDLAGDEAISGEAAFALAATYGFPLELTVELAGERGQTVDVDGYSTRDGAAPRGLARGRWSGARSEQRTSPGRRVSHPSSSETARSRC